MATKNKNDIKYYMDLAERMLKEDGERDRAFEEYDRMFHSDFELPKEVNDLQWIRTEVDTSPHDAVSAGTRVLSTLDPGITVQPTRKNLATKELANSWERNLLWQLKSADRRRQAGIVRDVVKSSLLYDEVVINIVDLDWQIKTMQTFKADTKRMEAASRYGRWLINTYNPRDVHVRYSNMMPEAVLLCTVKPAQQVIDEWGDLAKGLEPLTNQDMSDVTLYDYMDYDMRCVWATPKGGDKQGETVIVKPQKHDLPFLPWVAMVGGSTLEHKERYKRQPLLFSIYNSGQWKTSCIVKSLYTSEVIFQSAAARMKEEGPIEETTTEVDYGEPGRLMKVTPGNVATPLQPQTIDQALLAIDDRIGSAMERSTVSRILQGADIPSGTAFATLNLATQTAVGSLKPPKSLSEKALAEMFTVMLLWVEFTKQPLYAYDRDRKSATYGAEYVIDPAEIEPQAIYIEVELKPDVPTDRQQRANTGAMMIQTMDYSKERALEDVGVTDPQEVMRQRIFEKFLENNINQIMAMSQIQMQQAWQAGAQAGGVPGGEGFNPAEGGQPPAMANPEMTREMATGMDRMGMEVAEGV